MTYFLRSGNSFRVSTKESMDLHETLPAGNYVVKEMPMDGPLYLEAIDSFEIKGKVYGDTLKNASRILNTFDARPATTGVMLNGEKGSGKTLLAKKIAVDAAAEGMPTIVINAPWAGDKFNSFLQMIEQPCVILFDEFEKVYDKDDQEQILTLLDGVFPSKKLFVLTCNDKWRVDQHMRNRPGRIFYMIDFKGLSTEFIVEYCNDNLNNKSHIEKICNIASLFGEFNFDMLKALIEEMNRYDEGPEESLRMLNAKPEFDDGNKYAVEMTIKGVPLESKDQELKEWKGNPLQSKLNLDYRDYDGTTDSDGEPEWNWETAKFSHADIKKIDPNSGKFIFVNADGHGLTLSKIKEAGFNYYSAF